MQEAQATFIDLKKKINLGQIEVKNYRAKCETLSFGNDFASLNQSKALLLKLEVDLRMVEVECDFDER